MTLSFISTSLVPPPPSPPVYLVDMGPAELLGSCAIGLVPLLSLVLILLGLRLMRLTYPTVAPRITWRFGTVIHTLTRIAGLFIVAEVGSFVSAIALVLVGDAANFNTAPQILAWCAPLALGTFLMIASAEALRPLVSGREERMMFTAAIAAFFGGLLLIG